MKKIIAMALLSLVITISIPMLSFALTVDGVLYDKTMRCLIVTGGFGIYPGTNAPLSNDAGHTANLVGASGTPIASYGYWYNSVIGITRSKQVGAGSYVNGTFDGYVKKSTWQYNNSNTGTGYQGTISSSYRGIDRSIDKDLVTSPFKPAAPNLVWSFYLQKNSASGSISGLDSSDQASAAMTITGSGLPNSTSYGSTGTFSKSGTTSLYETVSYGNYYVSFFIPNASKYNITYKVSHMRGDKNKGLNNNIKYYNYAGSASFSSPSYYIESGGSLSVDVTVTKKSGTVIVDLYKGSGVTTPYENKAFYLYSSTGTFLKSAITNTSGYAYFYNMPYATYSVRSSTPPSEHYYSPSSQNVLLTGNSVTATVTLYRNTGSLNVYYLTEDNLSKGNVRFKITNPNGTISYYYTNSSGQILLSNVITGTYIVEQMEAPVDYEKAAAVTVTVSKSATSTIWVYNPILYDFSVDVYVPSNAKQLESFLITTVFRNKGGKTASNVPVKISFQGTVIYDTVVSIPAGGTLIKTISMSSDILGNKTILASINESKIKHESFTLDNTDVAFMTIDAATNLQIEFIDPNSEYREGTEVISAFKIKNVGVSNILPINNLKISLAISYPSGSVSIPQKTAVVIPANGDNLVYFRWTVPSGTVGKVFTLTATINPDNAIAENNVTDNMVTIAKTIIATNTSSPPNTRFEKFAPTDFLKMNPPNLTGITSSFWSEWVYEGGVLVKKTYGLSLNTGTLSIIPDINSPSRKYTGGYWYMGSGYGYMASWIVSTSTISGTTTPSNTSYTDTQVASVLLPEYKYSPVVSKYRSLSRVGTNSFQLPANPYAANNARLHFIPLWFPDGNYIAQGFASDLWTPAGMMSGYMNSNTIIISQSAYDDWYVGR
jgi:hypothetical protein